MKRRVRILHTSDWHLGQKFMHLDRREESRAALDWLLGALQKYDVDVLLVSGDVFDTGSPPSYAEEQYYRFLAGLAGTSCRQIVITAGNHDSPAHLEAPRRLLEALNIHVRVRVVGNEKAASRQDDSLLIPLHDADGELLSVVAASPFLRDRDLGPGLAGEHTADRQQRIRERIKAHYRELGQAMETYREADVPLIAMGHLYARGAEASDPERQKNIYLGDEKNMAASDFPEVFSYVALGHIHRAQAVDKKGRVRYSGSLIPLSFRETIDDKSVTLTTWEGGKLIETQLLPVPLFRRLKTLRGKTGEELLGKLQAFAERHEKDPLRPWLEMILEGDRAEAGLRLRLQEEASKLNMELLQLRLQHKRTAWMQEDTELVLEQLHPREVFEERCRSAQLPEDEMKKLQQTFDELLEWMQQSEEGI